MSATNVEGQIQPTEQLIAALLGRYKEAIFIGSEPIGTVRVNGTDGGVGQPVVDVNAKLDKSTAMSGRLIGVLDRLLIGLRQKTAVN